MQYTDKQIDGYIKRDMRKMFHIDWRAIAAASVDEVSSYRKMDSRLDVIFAKVSNDRLIRLAKEII